MNKQHYTDLGYDVSERVIQACATHLPPSSAMVITRVCDECNEHHEMKRSKYNPVCRKCVAPKINKARKDVSKTTCICGAPKSYRAKTCQVCVDITGENNPAFGKPNKRIQEQNERVRQDPTLAPNWRGGIAKGRSGRSQHWATQVKDGANNVCDCCGYSRKIALEAHHLVSHDVSTNEGRFDINNGVALCCNCHKEFHKKYGYGSNTCEQYSEFKENY
ncbi:MAG: HNH endonuclease signature motif containing protein [Emcibacteraceae bacterium]|nr:HNH endonuclease signature motif containing protein [Emcibacteraceae bacterium]